LLAVSAPLENEHYYVTSIMLIPAA
jgi:hypothetical protein